MTVGSAFDLINAYNVFNIKNKFIFLINQSIVVLRLFFPTLKTMTATALTVGLIYKIIPGAINMNHSILPLVTF